VIGLDLELEQNSRYEEGATVHFECHRKFRQNAFVSRMAIRRGTT